MNIFEKLGSIDRRYFYVLLIIVLLAPLITPIGLPVSVNKWTKNAYGKVDSLKSGDIVVMDWGYTVAGAADIEPQAAAVFKHLMSKNVKVIGIAFQDQGPMLMEKMFKQYEAQGKKYGEDFVNLGYLAGVETGMSAFVKDIPKATPKDFRGNTLDKLPLMKGIKSLTDTKMLLFFTTLYPSQWVRQAGPTKVPIIAGVVTTLGPDCEPYVQSGQFAGLLTGLRGGAEYEMMMNQPGTAVAAMDAQSMGHLLIVLFIIFGNIAHFTAKRRSANS